MALLLFTNTLYQPLTSPLLLPGTLSVEGALSLFFSLPCEAQGQTYADGGCGDEQLGGPLVFVK